MTNVLVLCAGKGQRFNDAGYDDPKQLIDVGGTLMVNLTTDSIRTSTSCHNLPFAVLTTLMFHLFFRYCFAMFFIWFQSLRAAIHT